MWRWRATVGLSAALSAAWCALAAPAAADAPLLKLDYQLPDALTEACPNVSSFRNLVVARLGYDPFDPRPEPPAAGEDVVQVVLVLRDRRIEAEALLSRAGRPVRSGRSLKGGVGECEAIVTALATTLAIALDEEHEQARAAAPPAPTVIVAPPPPPPLPPPPPVEHPHEPISVFVSLAPVVSVGLAPALSVGGEAGAGLRRGHFSIEALVRAEATPGATRVASGDRLNAAVFTGTALPCGEVAGARACVVLRLGKFEGSDPDVPVHVGTGTVYAAIGVRAGYAFRLTPAVTIEPSIEGTIPLIRTQLVVSSATVWTAPVIAGAAAVTAAVAF